MEGCIDLRRFKPAASARQHLFLGGLLWTVVGSGLGCFGVRWVLAAGSPWLLAVAAAVGLLKSRFILDPAADRIVGRIRARGDGRCIGGFLSWRTWALVLLMMASGRFLRGGILPTSVIGFVYVAVGLGLFLSSRKQWTAWARHGRK